MKTLLTAAAAVLALTLAGCGDDDETPTAEDPASKSPEASEPTTPPTVGTYPEFDAADYSYVLEQVCFCPVTGPIRVTVEDGEVASAIVTKGARGLPRGSEAPEYLWVTLNDVIAQANDTDAAAVDVTWPEGQDWPSKVAVDHIENATDDEITFLVRNVEVSEG